MEDGKMRKNAKINDNYYDLVKAIFDTIDNEYERLYWNEYQKEPDSPFRNKGGQYVNDVFSVHAYDWNLDELALDEHGTSDINFNYRNGDFCATWYKHCHRGLYFWSNKKKRINAEFLNRMLKDCLDSMRADFQLNRHQSKQG